MIRKRSRVGLLRHLLSIAVELSDPHPNWATVHRQLAWAKEVAADFEKKQEDSRR